MTSFLDRVKNFYWNHALITIFFIFNIIPTITSLTIEVSYFSYRGSLFYAIIYYILGIFLTYWGYIHRVPAKRQIQYVIVKRKFYYVAAALVCVGLIVAYKTLTELTDIGTLRNMISGGESVETLKGEISYGGLAGIFKMFACMPLCIFLVSSSIFFFSNYNSTTSKRLIGLMFFSFIALVVKTFIYFDRITLLAALLVFIHHFNYNKKLNKIIKIFIIVIIMMFAILLTALRMSDSGFGEFLGVYFNLGVLNLQVLIDKQELFNYDFTQTFLAPLSFIFKFFGWPFTTYSPKEYIWNDAQSFWGFLFIDFHWLGLLFMPVFGRVIKVIEINKTRSLFCMCFYFIALYTVFSFFTIPIIRSIEFWLMIVVSLFFSKICIKRYY